MNFKNIFLIIIIFITGCSDKKTKNINLIQFLPDGKIGTKYISFFTHTGYSIIKEEKTIIARTNKCVTFDVVLKKDDHIESQNKRHLCANNNVLYSDKGYTNEPLVNLNKKYWSGYKMYIGGKETEMICKFDSIGKIIFHTKEYDTFTIKCKAKDMTNTFLYAKGLGLVKIEQLVNNYGIVGGINLKTVVDSKGKK
jgi:hypothetical protein